MCFFICNNWYVLFRRLLSFVKINGRYSLKYLPTTQITLYLSIEYPGYVRKYSICGWWICSCLPCAWSSMAFYSLQNKRQVNKALFIQANWHIKVEWQMKKLTITTTIHHSNIVSKLIHDCYNESDIDKKIQMLYKINSLLPNICRINIPSLITDDYVDTILFQIEKICICCE